MVYIVVYMRDYVSGQGGAAAEVVCTLPSSTGSSHSRLRQTLLAGDFPLNTRSMQARIRFSMLFVRISNGGVLISAKLRLPQL